MMATQTEFQILKLAKNLGRFSLDDVLVMINSNKSKIQEILLKLENELIIKKMGETQYLYIKLKNTKKSTSKKNVEKLKKKISLKVKLTNSLTPIQLFNDEDELKIYESVPEGIKKRIYKYILLMNLTQGLIGQDLALSLEQIGKEYPKYNVSYCTFKRHQGRYLREGIKALIPKYHQRKRYKRIDPEIYEYFKKLYLHPRRFSMTKCLELIKESEEFKNAQIPDRTTLREHLYNEYTPKKIKEIRFRKISLPKIPKSEVKFRTKDLEKTDHLKFEYYIQAINYYQTSEEYLQKSTHYRQVQNGYFKNHLNPFFKELKFIEITHERINEFRETKTKEGLSLTTISMFLSSLSVIVNKYSNCKKQFILSGYNKLGTFSCEKKLSKEQITNILLAKTRIRLILLFVFSLGLSQAEILGLEYDDINFKDRTININKILYKDKIEKYRCKYQKRILYIPETLFSKIPKQGNGRIFNISPNELDKEISILGISLNIENLNYDDFINIYVKTLIDNNIPINLIAKTLAFGDIRDFLKKYENFIPAMIPKEFDPILKAQKLFKSL